MRVIILMPILIILIGLFLPRLVIVLLWLFSDWFSGVFGHFIIPILCFNFLPYTLLWYSAVINWFGGTWGIWQILIMILAVAADLGAVGRSRGSREP